MLVFGSKSFFLFFLLILHLGEPHTTGLFLIPKIDPPCICIEIVHTKFRDPRWKIVVSATLKSRVPKNSFFRGKRKLCSFFGAIIFHQGSQSFVCRMQNIYLTTAKKVLLYHTQGGGNSCIPGYRKTNLTVESVDC